MSKLRSAAVFSLCALFALLAMGLTLLSSGVYRTTAQSADRQFTHRTGLSYLVNQIHRSDRAGDVRVGAFGDGDALFLGETVGDYRYLTILYCHQGQLTELYMEEGTGLGPADGVAILPLEALDLSCQDGTITVTITAQEGETYSTAVVPRCGVTEEATA